MDGAFEDVFDDETQQEIIENGENGEAIGVLTPVNTDSKTGRFLPGNPGGPGRPAKARENAALDLMRQTVSPAKVVQTIVDLIEHQSSWRAREAGVRLYLAYMVGMPVQRSITASTKLETILSRLGEMDDDEFGQVEQQMRGGE